MISFHDPHSSSHRLMSKSYDTSQNILKGPLLISKTTCQETDDKKGKENEGELRISRENSKGMIKLGAKIRNPSGQIKFDAQKFGGRVEQPGNQIFTQSVKVGGNKPAVEKQDKQHGSNIHFAFRRVDSMEVSAKTDILTTSNNLQYSQKYGPMRVFGEDSNRKSQTQEIKTNIQALLNSDREKIQKVIQQKSNQIFELTRELAEQKKSSLSKAKQMQLDIQILKHTHHQSLLTLSSKIEILKKQNSFKDSLIAQYSKELKQLRDFKHSYRIELMKTKQECKKSIQEWKQKYSQAQAELRSLNSMNAILVEQKNRLESIIKTLNMKLLNLPQSTTENAKLPPSSLKRNTVGCNPGNTSFNTSSNPLLKVSESSKKNTLLQKDQEIIGLKKTVDMKNRVIFNLSEEKIKLEVKIEALNSLIDQNNQEMMKQRLSKMNEEFKYKC